ncbi:MAG: phage tail sheath subtilisin-like domain-containing protein [Myxococcales bacterium]|nr:phage tail sheath subtilisin-like domain-containing protein [Myxococcales bacterium]
MQPPLVPGVYGGRRPVPAPAPARTDVCGFVGMESRIRATSSQLAPSAHRLAVQVVAFSATHADGDRWSIPSTPLTLSESDTEAGLADGHSQVYAVLAVENEDDAITVLAKAGIAQPGRSARAPTDAALAGQLGGRHLRLCDVAVRREGLRAFVTVEPRLPPVAVDDWEAFVLEHGALAPFDGTLLSRTVRAFFANGGARCHVCTVARPDPDDAAGLRQAATAMVGVAGAPEREATGMERLLLIEEVAMVALPDLLARRSLQSEALPLPPSEQAACFGPCGPGLTPITAQVPDTPGAPLFPEDLVREVQRAAVGRAAFHRFRVQLLLSAPTRFDPSTGDYDSPSHPQAAAWQQALTGAVGDRAAAAVALYHPWLLAPDRDGDVPTALPPDGFVAGILARRDLQRGPAIAAANEAVYGAVGPARPLSDATLGQLYATPVHVNAVRTVPGRGLVLWGARTQSTDLWLRHLNVQRGLCAIARQLVAAMRPLVFEPITPQLQLQTSQVAMGVLLQLFGAGALRGATPDDAFEIVCDDSNNPPARIEAGQLACDIGVAIAAPAEFVRFRVQRSDEALTVQEDTP